jgi:hypothetical protein
MLQKQQNFAWRHNSALLRSTDPGRTINSALYQLAVTRKIAESVVFVVYKSILLASKEPLAFGLFAEHDFRLIVDKPDRQRLEIDSLQKLVLISLYVNLQQINCL